jgi:formamidopyrimidine-DNA glycosylase
VPELPDVEGFRRELAATLPGRRIREVHALDASILRNGSPQRLGRALRGDRFTAPRRHGKWLILPTRRGRALLVHSGMTGHPYYAPHGECERHDRLAVVLDRGQFRYADQRKLRGVWLADDERAIASITGEQGPDVLDGDHGALVAALRGGRGRLKSVLTDQARVAGIGNLLADEICWQARLHPELGVGELDEPGLRRLATVARRVTRTAARHGRVPPLRGWLTRVRDEPDARCPRCRTRLHASRVGGRRTLWCPRCQPH